MEVETESVSAVMRLGAPKREIAYGIALGMSG